MIVCNQKWCWGIQTWNKFILLSGCLGLCLSELNERYCGRSQMGIGMIMSLELAWLSPSLNSPWHANQLRGYVTPVQRQIKPRCWRKWVEFEGQWLKVNVSSRVIGWSIFEFVLTRKLALFRLHDACSRGKRRSPRNMETGVHVWEKCDEAGRGWGMEETGGSVETLLGQFVFFFAFNFFSAFLGVIMHWFQPFRLTESPEEKELG